MLLLFDVLQDIKKFKAKGEAQKATIKKRTLQVKKEFKTQLGLNVDQRREGGFGNTNTGNVARKAFENPVITAQICGVSPLLVSKLETIHRALAMDKDINTVEFEIFCEETLKVYFADAGWYNIPPTLHKVLVHGREIIEATPLAIGITSEEGSESNIKFTRQFYKHHTRKSSHSNTMFDLFHRMMDVSDPFLLSKQNIPHHQSTRPVHADLLRLIQTDEENRTMVIQQLPESEAQSLSESEIEDSDCSENGQEVCFELSILEDSS